MNKICLIATLATFVSCAEPITTDGEGWELVWNDEFNRDGSPDPASWGFERGFVRNNEAQYYLPQNVFCEDDDLLTESPEIANELRSSLEEWEQGLINPILWNEGIWNDVTREIHRDLMENRKVSCFTPEQLKRNKGSH